MATLTRKVAMALVGDGAASIVGALKPDPERYGRRYLIIDRHDLQRTDHCPMLDEDQAMVDALPAPAWAVDAALPKTIGRPPLAPELRSEPTQPRSVRLTDAEWSELQRRGVRGAGSLAEWLAQPAYPQSSSSG